MPAISLNQLSPCLKKIAEGKAAANRIFAIIDRIPLVRSLEMAIRPEVFRG
jgi:ATP-binding cassette, subfamily B (MDR/TAP), member 1